MRVNLCSISFRHELVSFRELARYALSAGFDGIELWGVHARSLNLQWRDRLRELVRDVRESGMSIAMMSDYVEFMGDEPFEEEWREKVRTARAFGTDKLRIFAGRRGSRSFGEEDWSVCASRLRELCRIAAEDEVYTVVETHPDTAADSLASTLRLLKEVDHPALRLNLDFLHLWEAGDDPLRAYEQLEPYVLNYHFKNVSSRERLPVFSPANIYSPNGSREGIVPLAEGELSYSPIVRKLAENPTDRPVSIEWFGPDPFEAVRKELEWLKRTEREVNQPKEGANVR
ncbi:3-dehydroshikimate dehydratase [Cohnella xylanilytica]|uniref:Sugar phosphate isomerase/epimerase n=1 Tax=Cohnella xylanilytica TaxID=557555 RepID=A0A841TRJ2_9BACL|nr:sugar phosphate isomerase/epimerase [Cohnella xylanilytica]MBB6690916.1 sugar phosphate isomerase/epimerase [Cohnella xylanilytica]GIO13734.1 3-dehydroshikimate dehydratase [Cohnella xylanilytica]